MNTTSPGELPLLSLNELRGKTSRQRWLWQGYIAAGAVTLLTSQWKSGKTTLMAILLAKMKDGGDLAGLRVERGRAVVVSEEGPEHWLRRAEKHALGDHVRWLCRPFRSRPTPGQWTELLDRLAELRDGLDLVVIDPLASFLPGEESHAGQMMEALTPLQRLTERGLAVLVLHHPRKGRSLAGQSARGSGALSGYADVLLEMSWFATDSPEDRRRRLRAWSRFEETPRLRVIEMNTDGTDYAALGDLADAEFAGHWATLREVLDAATEKLTRQEAEKAWPNREPSPDERTVGRLLERGVDAGRVCRSGNGHRGRPFRYWLAGKVLTDEIPELEPLGLEPGVRARVLVNAAKIVMNKTMRR